MNKKKVIMVSVIAASIGAYLGWRHYQKKKVHPNHILKDIQHQLKPYGHAYDIWLDCTPTIATINQHDTFVIKGGLMFQSKTQAQPTYYQFMADASNFQLLTLNKKASHA